MRLIGVIASLWTLASPALGGIVNSPESYPTSSMNAAGDYILAGDWRMMIYWDSRFHVSRHSESIRARQVFSGGISERNAAHAGALICDGQRAYLFAPERSASAPSGRLELIYEVAARQDEIRCSMAQDGSWAILNLASRKLLTSNWGEQILPQSFRQAWLDHSEHHLLIMTDRQDLLVQSLTSPEIKSSRSPFASFARSSRFQARSGTILYRNDFNLQTATYQPDGTAKDLVISPAQRIGIAPCDDNQVCAMSLGYDGSWLYFGYWGSFFGQGTNHQRLPVLMETGRSAQTALSHNNSQGQFVFTGPYDGDWGRLNDLRAGFNWHAVTSKSSWKPVEVPMNRMLLTKQYWHEQLGLQAARELLNEQRLSAEPTLIAVIDSGINPKHPQIDLRLRLKDNEFINGLDNDGNGLIDDIYGFDFVLETHEALDSFGHGAHVAALLAADYQGQSFSPADQAELLVTRALDRSWRSNSIDLARAIYYAVDEGAEVLNLSWGGGRPSFALADAIAYANSQAVAIFTSAGNDRIDHDRYPQVPGIFPGVISIAASDSRGRLAGYSNYGANSVGFLAPGSDIISSHLGGELRSMSGTSMAAPLAASVYAQILGLIKGLRVDLAPIQQRQLALDLMCQSAEPQPAWASCGLIRMDFAVSRLLANRADIFPDHEP